MLLTLTFFPFSRDFAKIKNKKYEFTITLCNRGMIVYSYFI